MTYTRKLGCLALTLTLLLSPLTIPKNACAEENPDLSTITKLELFEAIKLQKEQIGDLKKLTGVNEDQITQLNEYLNDCRTGRRGEIKDCTSKLVKCESRSRTAYIIGTVIAVIGAGFGVGMYAGR